MVAAVLIGSLLPLIAVGTWGLGAILLAVAPIALVAGAKNRTFWASVLWGEVAVAVVGGIWALLLW
ncbi:hypothetical protein QSJ19_25970 [Gordonia sp. ABSL11-1]|uniref:hypothetical protein n=1 Tax=Gordonia sp. ABSL11-1 TaxID=3053924 RepID=UPI002573EB62|nr:hypothetical protein [Gordonia sp. ABSL11-1]MDL9948964.1 hypothetical protein [Gordonia sp. ABSL11-1]